MMTTTTLLIASPFPAMRAGLRLLLNTTDITVAGEAATDEQALDLAETLAPQVVVYDLALDSDDLLNALWQLRRTLPNTPVLALSESPSDPRTMRALQAGARGCLPKTAAADELAGAVRQVAAGEMVLPPTATSALLQQLRGEGLPVETLTTREQQVLQAVAVGQTNKAIAIKLGISDHTVKFHLASAMSKLGAASRAEAVAIALRRGLISL